ncbi:hypothetical protein KO507_15050 [Gilvimarinus agarilyticus]|uniref:hypothetical protein n=1 Tax=Gilvimarinus sp. 2_MG-2023 TaxID=3062666 RepID=UPI001C0A01C1|nr:hypothetical protein [Gilvimarinus sp. 2_MG-2023]MBU2887085.1 hypothetical protein [Gilvimarinus agarilyticus]MDO6571744.1 hypothetical protein [Gilvimarinus sp. 2_MG-2023]
MNITLVKKILADGSPCRKCADVLHKLEQGGYLAQIDQIVEAIETDPDSRGMQLAKQYEVDRAPFFLVEQDDGSTEVYTVYLKFQMEVLDA